MGIDWYHHFKRSITYMACADISSMFVFVLQGRRKTEKGTKLLTRGCAAQHILTHKFGYGRHTCNYLEAISKSINMRPATLITEIQSHL
jgi:hypothetical protein